MALFNRKKPSGKAPSFYHRENLIQNKKDLNDYRSRPANLHTAIPIRYMGVDMQELNMERMEATVGTDWTHFEHEEVIDGHEVYYYRRKAGNVSMLIQFHYLNKRFLMVATKFYADYLLTDKEKQDIKGRLQDRYNDVEMPAKVIDFGVTDQDGNALLAVDNVFCYIIYMPGSVRKGTYDDLLTGSKSTDKLDDIANLL